MAISGAGAEVICYAPDGSVDRVIEMPVEKVTSVMFGVILRPDLASLVGISGLLGHGPALPFSPRRPVEAILI